MSAREKVNTVRLSIFLSPKDAKKIKVISEQKGMSVSGLIRTVVIEYLANK